MQSKNIYTFSEVYYSFLYSNTQYDTYTFDQKNDNRCKAYIYLWTYKFAFEDWIL